MRLITLNTWAGRSLHPLMRFFRKYKESTDIFCLQEVHNTEQSVVDERHPDEHIYGPLFNKISDELEGFKGSFAYFEDEPKRMSLAIFVRRELPIKKIEDLVVFTPEQPKEVGSIVLSSRKLQYVTLEEGDRELLVANYHGLWNGGPKTDTSERLEQSKKLVDFLGQFHGPKILCGDMNLLPETQSVALLADGMRDLVKEYKVDSTRTSLYRHFENPEEPNFADYVFVSPDIIVHDFKVLPDIVSDHSPLFLEFSL